jgi:hypothetical protein
MPKLMKPSTDLPTLLKAPATADATIEKAARTPDANARNAADTGPRLFISKFRRAMRTLTIRLPTMRRIVAATSNALNDT